MLGAHAKARNRGGDELRRRCPMRIRREVEDDGTDTRAPLVSDSRRGIFLSAMERGEGTRASHHWALARRKAGPATLWPKRRSEEAVKKARPQRCVGPRRERKPSWAKNERENFFLFISCLFLNSIFKSIFKLSLK